MINCHDSRNTRYLPDSSNLLCNFQLTIQIYLVFVVCSVLLVRYPILTMPNKFEGYSFRISILLPSENVTTTVIHMHGDVKFANAFYRIVIPDCSDGLSFV